MAKYLSILVNGGKQINPTIIKNIVNADETEVSKSDIQKKVNERLGNEDTNQEDIEISEENLSAILEGMRDVTSESGGTAYKIFKNFNISIGGKTGSAQTGTSTNAWFTGFAPYDNPEIAIVVIIENRWFRFTCMLSSKRYYCTIFWNEFRRNKWRFNSYSNNRNE